MTIEINEARAILRNYHALVERAYKGDYDAIIAIVDLENAIERANLTDRQAGAIRLYYIDGYFEDVHKSGDTQTQAARKLGLTQQALSARILRAESRIDKAFKSKRGAE